MQETIREIATVFLSTGENDENTVLWLKGLADFEAMEITERVRFGSMAGSLMDLTVFTDEELSEMVRIQTEAEMRLLEAGE